MMEYHDNSEPAYRDYGQIANNEAVGIPAEDVDAALRRIEDEVALISPLGAILFHPIIRKERERLGLKV